MRTSFADALSPLSRTLPRAVRNIEILRVSAQLKGDDFGKSAKIARAAVLKWAASPKRSAGTFPQEAWDHRDFDLMAGGRNSAGVRISTESIDLWALRADDPDKNVAGRIWSIEVVIGGGVQQRPHLSLRLIVSTTEDNFSVEPHVPGTVLQMIDAPGLIRGSREIMKIPRLIKSENDAEDLCDHLEDPERRLPVFVVVVPHGEDSTPLIDDLSVAKAVAGIARVVRVPEEYTRILTTRFGKYRSVFNAGVRASCCLSVISHPVLQIDSKAFETNHRWPTLQRHKTQHRHRKKQSCKLMLSPRLGATLSCQYVRVFAYSSLLNWLFKYRPQFPEPF